MAGSGKQGIGPGQESVQGLQVKVYGPGSHTPFIETSSGVRFPTGPRYTHTGAVSSSLLLPSPSLSHPPAFGREGGGMGGVCV